ncbi:glycosyltransferase family 1 protein [Sphingobacterium oryzagri]|uniref:Glycosyltransferase family 1 protein n=1 Tax=Sphingobacterium oryzagri TaxID=3025669 RepID=A0ABY7WNQ0_9SPHI|nr:glycosyltransferase family 1 protein [Sphingobacterium sp. KACC 22765]WDF68969.1 glycosyltransferase family 1 protein [Sphingobacterium sp. KACC 22765]
MKVVYFNRKNNYKEQSVEKLFRVLKSTLVKKGVIIEDIENPYGSGLINLIRSLFFFKSKESTCVTHVTGQINFANVLFKDTSRTIITVHDLTLYRNLSYLRLKIFLIFWVYLPFSRARYITVISKKSKDEIVKLMPKIESKIVIIPNCLTTEVYAETIIKKNVVPRVLIVGTRSNKNIERAITSLIGLNIELTIVGELDKTQSDLLRNSEVSYKNLTFISDQKLNEVYDESDILLFPSLYEGFGLPILEAQARNVIVITSNIEPLEEVAGGGGILVDPMDDSSIRSGVLQVLEMSDDEKLKLLIKGKENIKLYTVDYVAEQYLAIYKELNNDE